MTEAIPPSLSNGFAIICLLLQKPFGERKKDNNNNNNNNDNNNNNNNNNKLICTLKCKKHDTDTGPSNYLSFSTLQVRCEKTET
jgi:hypothetical protein